MSERNNSMSQPPPAFHAVSIQSLLEAEMDGGITLLLGHWAVATLVPLISYMEESYNALQTSHPEHETFASVEFPWAVGAQEVYNAILDMVRGNRNPYSPTVTDGDIVQIMEKVLIYGLLQTRLMRMVLAGEGQTKNDILNAQPQGTDKLWEEIHAGIMEDLADEFLNLMQERPDAPADQGSSGSPEGTQSEGRSDEAPDPQSGSEEGTSDQSP